MPHDFYTHAEDNRVCIPVDDYWFVPLDAGGEGFECGRSHGPVSPSATSEDEAPTEWVVKLVTPPHKVGGLSLHQCTECFALVVEDFMPDHMAKAHNE